MNIERNLLEIKKNNTQLIIKLCSSFFNFFIGFSFINFYYIKKQILISIDIKEIQIISKDNIFLSSDLFSLILPIFGFFILFKGLKQMVDFFIEENNIEIKNYNYKELSNCKIDSLFLNKNINIDLETISLIFYKEEYISYILKNYKDNLIDVIYERNSVSHINLQLKSNEEILNKFCVFLIENDLLENKDYDFFARYVNKYSTNKNLIYFIKHEKVFTSNIFNKSLKSMNIYI